MKVSPVQPVVPTTNVVRRLHNQPTLPTVKRLEKPYEGVTDPAEWIHNNKFHSTTKEAFRGADYGTAIWRCETEFEYGLRQVKEIVLGFVMVSLILGGFYLFASWIVEVTK